MKNLVKDVKAAAKVFCEIRKGRSEGRQIGVQTNIQIPTFSMGCGFYDTVEGCTLSHCGQKIADSLDDAFMGLPFEERRRMTSVPEDGEFIERARFWSELMAPVLTPKQHHIAMMQILGWYVHIKHLRNGAGQ